MAGSERAGKVQTVQGLIDPEKLGVTLMHEHLLMKIPEFFWGEPTVASDAFLRQPIEMKNLGWLREHSGQHFGDFELSNELEINNEAREFYVNGGDTIVDATPNGLKRDPLGLRRISRRTGLNVIAGCGYYVKEAHPKDLTSKTLEQVRDEIVKDVTEGISDTDICSGVIGEIGMSLPRSNAEEKVLRAAARAQVETGASVIVHPARTRENPMEVIKILEGEGANLQRVIMHCLDRTIDTMEGFRAIADKGCYLGFDLFGNTGFYEHPVQDFVVPNDQGRIEWIKKLVDAGYSEKIMISQDVADRTMLTANGGYGYAHILKNVVPWMRKRGITWEQVETILVGNPRRALTFERV